MSARGGPRRRLAIGLAVLALALLALAVLAYLHLTRKAWWELALEQAPVSCGCVAFRLDDIQDYFTREAQMDLIKMFLDEKAPLTIGVIGGSLQHDHELIQFLQRAVSNGIEVANHGWVHSDHTAMTFDEQRASIVRTNELISALFGTEARTFIPPLNPFNNDTIAVMRETGLTHVSGSVFLQADPPPYPLKNGDGIFHFPQTAFVSDVDTPTGVWRIVSNEQVLTDIRSSVKQYGFAVVVMHSVAYYDRKDSGYVYQRSRLEPLRALLKEVGKEFNLIWIREIDRPQWIPKDALRSGRLYSHTISWQGRSVAIMASSRELQIKVLGEALVLSPTRASWRSPFLLLLPEAVVPQEPRVVAEGTILPVLRWFNHYSRTWIIYVDPPRSVEPLHILSNPAP